MSSVHIDGHDYKRCMLCAEWTDFDDLMYVPPVRAFDKDEDAALDYASEEYRQAAREWFGLDVCAACASREPSAYRAPTVTLRLPPTE